MDESQRLRGPKSLEILNAIAHAYDYDRNITFIFSGSEVGLLLDFLKIDVPTSPLYGRYYYNLSIERFSEQMAKDFLKTGFKELNISVAEETLDEAVTFFDGIPGWLTFFGNEVSRGNEKIEVVKDMAINLARDELEHLIKTRASRRYATVLNGIAKGENSWSRIKKYVEENEGTTISTSILSNIINTLERMSIIKDYKFLDPVYKEAALKL